MRGQEPGDVQPGCRLPEARVALYGFARAGSQQPGPRVDTMQREGIRIQLSDEHGETTLDTLLF